MKLLFHFLLLGCISNVFAQSTLQPTRLVTQRTQSSTIPLANSEDTYHYYDSNGVIYKSKINFWNGTEWTPGFLLFYTTNSNGKTVQVLYQQWSPNTSSWFDSYKYINEYNNNGSLTSQIQEYWDSISNIWIASYVFLFQYSPSGKEIQKTYRGNQNGLQINGWRNLSTYDANDRLSTLISQSWVNGIYQNSNKITYQYAGNAEDYETSTTSYWDASTDSWKDPIYRSTITYAPNQRVDTQEHYNLSDWILEFRNTISYDGNGQILSEKGERWNVTPPMWELSFNFENTYNADQSLSKVTKDAKDFFSSEYYTFLVIDYEYDTYLNTPSPSLGTSVKLMPNPAHYFIEVTIDNEQPALLYLYDMHGALVQQSKTNGKSIQISLIGQSAGTYFLHVVQNGVIKVMPVVKI